MTCFHLYCDRMIRDGLPFITYPTPPYLLLREIMGPRPETPIVRRWLFISSSGGFGSAKYEASFQEEKVQLESEKYVKGQSQKVSIQDQKSKVFVYDATLRKLFAKPLEGENVNYKAIFEITPFFPVHLGNGKIPVTLKIKNTNLYLSCSQEDKLIPQENDKLQANEIEIDNDTKPFFFFREDKLNYSTFESVMYPQSYMCTLTEEDKPVTITRTDINQVYIELVLKDEATGKNNELITREGTSSGDSGMYYLYDRFYLQDSMNYIVTM